MTRRRASSNADGLERTLKALHALGRLEQVDEAMIALARGLARAVDSDPSNAALWREYRAAVEALREAGQDGDDGSFAEFLASVQTPMGHPPQP